MSDYYPSDDSGSFLSLLAMPFVWGKQNLRSYRSSSWPATNGVIETGEVFWGGRSLTNSNFEYATAKVGYAYCVDGQFYSGYHTEWFGTAEEAGDYVNVWKGCTMRVRYLPRRPEVSVWCEQEQVEE
jgi:hypothetical protein